MVFLVTCFFSHSFEELNNAFELQFSQVHFYTLSDTGNMQGHAAQIFKSGNIVKHCLTLKLVGAP